MKKYNYQEFKKDPRTYSQTGKPFPRITQAVFNCIDNKTTSEEQVFLEIDRIYVTGGKPRGEGYIKRAKKAAIKLLNQMEF